MGVRPRSARALAFLRVALAAVGTVVVLAGQYSVPMIAVLVPVEAVATVASPTAVPLTPAVVGAACYLGLLSTAAAWCLWYTGPAVADAGTVAVFFFAQPVVGAALGALLLGETLGLGYVLGGAVMGGGIYRVSTAGGD